MIKNYFFAFLLCFAVSTNAQVNYNANGNAGFGGPVGQSTLSIDDDGTTITFTITKGAADFNDALIIYLDTGVSGRNVIDSEVNDNNDPLRTAISNGDSSGFASNVTFAPGFEAFYAIGVSPDFIGLFSIPPTGPVGSNGLGFEGTLVGFPAFNNTDPVITFSVDWATLGLTSSDSIDFVGLYLSGTAFNSDEAYGDGISPGATGGTDVAFTNFLTYSQSLGVDSTTLDTVKTSVNNKILNIHGLKDSSSVSVFNVLGQNIKNQDFTNKERIAIDLSEESTGLYIVRLQSGTHQKTIKILLN